ncbi:biotin-dependent carboxyltransferase family protein [Mariniflexile jejuense]|uniref:Biotin-dependent carboxyltransferase family protein n=1 Tax=Mariniflexile jejuense TaxID=1173582 RepID=A0ABW3JF08_9FLAO
MIKVLSAGLYSSIQDFGRYGSQQYGVPYSGVMDRYSAGLVNLILGNPETVAVIEMTITGVKLQFQNDTYICVSGADMSPDVNGNAIQLNKIIKINNGDIVSFGKLKTGVYCYLAVLGGFKTESVLGSQSMYKGITNQFKLLKNDVVNFDLNNSFLINKNASIKVNINHFKTDEIEVFKGPEFDLLIEKQQSKLIQQVFTISKDINRMAYQLEESLENNLEPIITSVVLSGTVQLTPSGKLIVLMRDCQTTGGYPRVFQLKESAINILAQKFTGNTIRFKLDLSEF